MTRQDEIRTILKRHFLNQGPSCNPLDELDTAAEAIAALPVDRVEAMAALVYSPMARLHLVPGCNGGHFVVRGKHKELKCNCLKIVGNCDHVRAVELYLGRVGE